MSDYIDVKWEVTNCDPVCISKVEIENSRTVKEAMGIIIDIVDQFMPNYLNIKLVNEDEVVEFIKRVMAEPGDAQG